MNYNILWVPTILFIKNWQIIKQTVWVKTEEELAKIIELLK